MTAPGWGATVLGVLLAAVALRDVFHTLLRPSGAGSLSTLIFRLVWRAAHRGLPRTLGMAGPLGFVLTIGAWTAMVAAGFALIYWPHLPGAFQIAEGVAQEAREGFFDAIYVSMVAFTTVGFGDIVAESTPLRLALTLQSALGFALLTASITWTLSIYPALNRRRALAGQVATLLDDAGELRMADPPVVLAMVLHSVAEQLGAVRVDLIQYPSTYFFHGPAPDLRFPSALRRLDAALRDDRLPLETHGAAQAVRDTIASLADTLATGPYGLRARDGTTVVEAFAADHRA